jgi:hypothetical protein
VVVVAGLTVGVGLGLTCGTLGDVVGGLMLTNAVGVITGRT